jgi:hypothetical protein
MADENQTLSLKELRRIHSEQGKKLREAEKLANVNPYELHKQLMAERQKAKTLSGQDIGAIPAIVNRPRRDRCIASFVEFCNTYLPDWFTLNWSPYHYKAASKIERAVRSGGLFAFSMPRGSGKTTMCRAAVLWAILCGQCKSVVLLAAAERSAERHLKQGLKKTLLKNQLLMDDFPHAIYPIRKLDGESKGAGGQRYKGEKTFIEWQSNQITFAWIPEPDSLSSGAVIETMGMTAEIRGPLYSLPDGSQMRPQLVLADDPQTRESAKSLTQSNSRVQTICGDVAYLAGPDSPIAVVCPMTVIYQGDMADQLLDREKHPEWQGERTRMVESFPKNLHLWDKYADILRQSQMKDGTPEEANKFYESNLKAMNEGCVVTWPERFYPDELSAIQHAMNKKIRDEASFYSECQNEPVNIQEEVVNLTVDEICKRTTGYPEGTVPADCTEVTCFTDIQQDHMFWMRCGWTPQFTGYVLDYGGWPDQGRSYFTRHDVRIKLSGKYGNDETAMVYNALEELAEKLVAHPLKTMDNREISVGRWCIDGGYFQRLPGLEGYVAQSKYKRLIAMTRGHFVGKNERPLSLSTYAIEQRIGPYEWYWRGGKKDGGWITFNPNFWKMRVMLALMVEKMARGSIQLFNASPLRHRMLAEHLLAETARKVMGKSGTVWEFSEIAGRDNEGLDCLVGCALGAQTLGIVPDQERTRGAKKKARTLAEMAAAARGRK